MLKKQYRLSEKEVKKVLKFWKPFFSYGVVLNKIKSKIPHNRFWIVIWSKSVVNNVTRNFFRRRFYNLVSELLENNTKESYDIVFVVKKTTKLDKKDKQSILSFEKDTNFLIAKNK